MHRIDYDTRRALYCGPTAIAALTGFPASRVLAAIDRYRGDDAFNAGGRLKGVRGMSIPEVVGVLAKLGLKAIRVPTPEQPTVAQRLSQLARSPSPSLPRVIRIRGHFIAVGPSARRVCDTKTKQPVPAKQGPKRRAHVTDEIVVLGMWPSGPSRGY